MKIFTFIVISCLLYIDIVALHAQQYIYESEVIGKRTRRWMVYLPADYDQNIQYPLYINMHGFTSNGNQQKTYSNFNNIADEKGAIVVYPNGVDKRWNSGVTFGIETDIDDVAFLSMLIDRMILLYNADPNKVYSTGFSAGGFMSYRLACERANRIAAIAPVVGSINNSVLATCTPARPFPIVAFNGTSDALTSYGGIPGNFPSIKEVMTFWSEKNGCDMIPDSTDLPNINTTDLCTVTKIEYQNCADGVEQILFRINGGGHTWPGSDIPGLGSTNQDISANEEIWKFCNQYTIPEAYRCGAPQNLSIDLSTDNIHQFSWEEQDGVAFYSIALIDAENNILFIDSLIDNHLNIELINPELYHWSVASQCSSGYVAWAAKQAVKPMPTRIKNSSKSSLSIYPNPAQNKINISNAPHLSISAWVLFDASGKEYTITPTSNGQDISIDISELPFGIYYISTNHHIGSFIKLP